MAVHRDALDVAGPDYAGRIPLTHMSADEEDRPTTGDWLAFDSTTRRTMAIYPRSSLFKRRSAGTANRMQLIAANVDTVFFVSSANHDFNVSRLERYLALAHEAKVLPVVVITKIDLVEDAAAFIENARAIRQGLLVEAIDARDPHGLGPLAPWLGRGQTIALMGSSGVGKSTIVNTMMGTSIQATQGIREDDAKGRHTTSGRSLHRMPPGAWLMDTPGMRELQIVDASLGIDAVFDDLTALALKCRFTDCHHGNEPGCAVREAVEAGTIDPGRLKRFQKLRREERKNSEAVHEAHDRYRKFGKLAKKVQAEKVKRTRDW